MRRYVGDIEIPLPIPTPDFPDKPIVPPTGGNTPDRVPIPPPTTKGDGLSGVGWLFLGFLAALAFSRR